MTTLSRTDEILRGEDAAREQAEDNEHDRQLEEREAPDPDWRAAMSRP